MSDTRPLQVALLISVLFHSIFFLGLPHIPLFEHIRPLEKVEITYYKIIDEAKGKEISKKQPDLTLKKLPEIKKEEISKPPKPAAEKTEILKTKAEHIQETKKIKEKTFETVVKEETDDAKKAIYISYYRAVREKIKQYADRDYPRRGRLGEGEVFLSFIVASSGELLQVKIINEWSVDDVLLRNIAINSIRNASPFPPFPSGMEHFQITFNIIISFENK